MTKKVEKNKVYPLAEAIKLAKETSTTKFDGSLEVHVRLGIDLKKTEQQVRGTIVLPFGTGKTKKIAAFVGPDKEKDAKEAGADLAGGQELIDQIKATGKVDFEIAVATPDLMPKMAAIAKILGPKGLMPSPKNETITTNLKKTIGELKGGKVKTFDISPRDFGIKKARPEEFRGGDPAENAKITMDILSEEKGPAYDIVILNAGCAIYAADKALNIKEGIKLAEESIESGAALGKLQELKEATNA